MKMRSLAPALLPAAFTLGVASVAAAQANPAGPVVIADSLAAAGDTAGAIGVLESAVRTNKKDAVAWHRLGMLHWNMGRGKRSPSYMSDAKAIRALQAADTSLRLATQFAPDSARYWMSLAKFNLQSGLSLTRFAAKGEVDNALEAAIRSGDSLMMAVAADEVGMATWRRYELSANRALTTDGQAIQVGNFSNWSRSKARDYINSFVYKIKPPTGETDYLNALERFRYAIQGDPSNQRIGRHLYMALGERGRWEEMRDIASQRLKRYPLDYQSLLARGLAAHRMNDPKAAAVAFDSAFSIMDDVERERLTRFTRILRPTVSKAPKGQIGDSLTYSKLPDAQKRGLEAMYWLVSDPLTLTTENEYRLEFLARVVYADFRWTDEDIPVRGADSERGDVFVRYGPPDFETTVPGGSGGAGGVTVVWMYLNGMVFFFDMAPGFATARVAFNDKDFVDHVKSTVPVTWDNIPATRLLDTIPVRVARFRTGTADSADVVITARIPTDSLVRGLEMTRAPVDVDFRVFDQFVRIQGIESVQTSIRPDSASAPLGRTWTRRVGPGINVLRVEALQADSRRAARAVTRLNPEAASGFGMSDVLLGNKPEARDGALPKRWTEVAMEPTAGVYPAGSPIGLVWEMYELAQRDGSARYRVAINVQRTDRGPLGNFAARVFDGLGRSVGRAQTRRDNLTISFDRTVATAPTLVEMLSLDLSEYPRGSYRVRVDVLDITSNRKTSRTTDFEIR